MRAVDTNGLARLVTRDDPRRLRAVESFVSGGAWVGRPVVAETPRVLTAVYDLGPAAVATAVAMLLGHEHLTIQGAEVVAAALEHPRRHPQSSFSGRLVLETARKRGHPPVGTFDRRSARLDGTRRL